MIYALSVVSASTVTDNTISGKDNSIESTNILHSDKLNNENTLKPVSSTNNTENSTDNKTDNNTNNNSYNKTVKPTKNTYDKYYPNYKQSTVATSYKIYKNNHLIQQTNVITVQSLNMIFNQSFTNGHILVLIDGELVFNGTTTDDIYTVILQITSNLLELHEIKVVYTDKDNNIDTYTEYIKIE